MADDNSQNLQGVSETDSQNLLGQVNGLAPNVLNVLSVTCAKKDILMTLPFSMSKLTQDRLSGLQDSVDRFFNAMQNAVTQVCRIHEQDCNAADDDGPSSVG